MKALFMGFILLITMNLQAQTTSTPKEVVTKLFVATDQHNWKEVEQLFGSEVNLDYSSMNGNPPVILTPKQITTSWKTILPGFESTHHQLGNFITELKEDKAYVSCYGTASHFLTDDNGNIWTVVGTYDFELIHNEGWVITFMKFNFKYQDGNLSLPEKAMLLLK